MHACWVLHLHSRACQAVGHVWRHLGDTWVSYKAQPGASQGDSTQRWVKDLDVMLGAESAVLILDDTEGVWPRHSANLLQARVQLRNQHHE